MKDTVGNFSLWLDKKFKEGKVNNISQTQYWVDCFLKEIKQDVSHAISETEDKK